MQQSALPSGDAVPAALLQWKMGFCSSAIFTSLTFLVLPEDRVPLRAARSRGMLLFHPHVIHFSKMCSAVFVELVTILVVCVVKETQIMDIFQFFCLASCYQFSSHPHFCMCLMLRWTPKSKVTVFSWPSWTIALQFFCLLQNPLIITYSTGKCQWDLAFGSGL